MCWTPTRQEKNELELIIKRRLNAGELPKSPKAPAVVIDEYLRILVKARSMEQAKALAAIVKNFTQLSKLNAFGLKKIQQCDTASLDHIEQMQQGSQAMHAAGADRNRRTERQQQQVVDRTNEINGYLRNIDASYTRHQGGTPAASLNLNPNNSGTFRNVERIVLDDYGTDRVEWYVMRGGASQARDRSIGKRFITICGQQEIYYTDGGTHAGRQGDWYFRRAGGNKWVKLGLSS